MAKPHQGDNPDKHAGQPEAQPGKKAGSEQPQVGSQEVKTAEAARTNPSDGSLANRRKLMATQDNSIEIVSNGKVSSRQSQLSEKDLHSHKDKPVAPKSEGEHKVEPPPPHPAAAGIAPRQFQDTRTPGEKLHDFVSAAIKRAEDPQSYHRYMQEEVQKFIGIGEGLNMAKEETKGAAATAWKALNDGTVARFLATPNAINDPLYKIICTTLDAMPKDPHSAHKALEHMGEELIKASNAYTAMSPRDKGHVIGKTMFGMVNPEGSTEAGEAALKIADNVATHVDAKVMSGLTKSYEAAQSLAKATPKAAGHAKQMLLDYVSRMHLTPHEMQLAGIPEGYFDGMSVSSATAKSGIDKSEHMLAMSGPKDVPGPKIPEGGHAPESGLRNKDISEAERPLNFERAREHAIRINAEAKASEKYVTPSMHEMAKRSGGQMVGLEHSVKEVDSLTRKLALGERPETIKDALRYTMSFKPERFTEGVKSVLEQMKTMGYETLKVKNTFDAEQVYKGVNCSFQSKTGQVFELQFHTPDSFFVKDKLNHKIYELSRELVIKDEVTGKHVLRNAGELIEVAKKFHGKLIQYPELDQIVGELAAKQGGVREFAQDLQNKLTKKMLDNYEGCDIPPGVNGIKDFSIKGPDKT